MPPSTRFRRSISIPLTGEVPAKNDPLEMLEILLALDRSVIEVSMQLYNLDQRDRRKMRSENRRLHAAVRNQFPHLMRVTCKKAA